MNNIAIFASGTGSNFTAIYQAIQNKELDANIAGFVTDRPSCQALINAKKYQLDTFSFNPKDYQSKESYEKEIVSFLSNKEIKLIVLAGYMRLIGSTLLNKYEGIIINIHPSLLPKYKGKDAVGQAMKDKATKTGVSIHYVDQGMDTGAIIKQESLDISNMASREEIEIAIHKIEHKLYKKVIQGLLEGTIWNEH